MNPNYNRDEESLADGEESISSITIRNSRDKIKKCVVTIALLGLVAFAVAMIGYGVVYTEEGKFTGENHLKEASETNDRVAIFHESEDEDLPEPEPLQQGSLTPDQQGRRRNKTLPGNASTKHPVSLLHEMGNNVTTVISGCPNAHPFFKAVLTVGLESYTGYGKNKKAAKKMAAQFACAAIYKLSYDDLPTSVQMQALIQKCGLNSTP